jgi:hypothetical protein
MNKKLSDLASIAEIVSGIAVLVTLIVLVLSVRENTETIRTTSYAGNVDSLLEHETAIISDPELSRIYYLWVTGDTDQLEQADLYQLVIIQTGQFRIYEKAYFMHQRRLLGDPEWERFVTSLCGGYASVQNDDTEFGAMVADFETLPFTQEFKDFTRQTCT